MRQEKLQSGVVVVYIGKVAGANDGGDYTLTCPLGDESLRLHYYMIRLWEIAAENLLKMDKVALLSLIGQTKINNNTEIIPEAM